jgi:hypothetical protein
VEEGEGVMAHPDFGIKPRCCGKDMQLDYDDDNHWFECSSCDATSPVPEGYWDDSPEELKPCPFCGTDMKLPDPEECSGTFIEFGCEGCGQAQVSLQISDFMTIEERHADNFQDHRYSLKYINRVLREAQAAWNTRA